MAQKITSFFPLFFLLLLYFNFKEPGYQTVLHTYILVWWPSTTCTMHICCWLYETWALFLATLIQTLNKSCCLAISFAFSVKPLKTAIHCTPVVHIQECNQKWNITDLEEFIFTLCTLSTRRSFVHLSLTHVWFHLLYIKDITLWVLCNNCNTQSKKLTALAPFALPFLFSNRDSVQMSFEKKKEIMPRNDNSVSNCMLYRNVLLSIGQNKNTHKKQINRNWNSTEMAAIQSHTCQPPHPSKRT